MTIKQISVFIENKAGTLQRVLDTLKEAGIQLIASTLADTLDFGIYRVICSEPTRAFEALKSHGIAATFSDVFAIALDNEPGRAADALEIFAHEDVEITYLYSFLLAGKGILVFRTGDAERAKEIIMLERLHFITDDELRTLAVSAAK